MKLERNFDQISRVIRMDTRISADAEYVYGVLCFLSNYCSKDPSNRVVRVTVDNLCVWCKGKTKKFINKAINELVAYNYISKEKVQLSAYQMNQYTLLDPPEVDVVKMTFDERKKKYQCKRGKMGVANDMMESGQYNNVAVVDDMDIDIDNQFSNCVGTIEQGDDDQKAEIKVEEKAECKAAEKKADNEVAEIYNFDQPFEFDDTVDYWEKGMENVDEDTFNKFLVRRFPKNDNVFNSMIDKMIADKKIGWKKTDGKMRYNVYQITNDEYDKCYHDAVRKCAVAVS